MLIAMLMDGGAVLLAGRAVMIAGGAVMMAGGAVITDGECYDDGWRSCNLRLCLLHGRIAQYVVNIN